MRRHGLVQVTLASLVVLGPPLVAVAQDCAPTTFEGAFAGEVTLCQNWDAEAQQVFWFRSQGSQIIPYDWFLALEQKDALAPFRDDAHMDGYRYLPQAPTALNPDGLPIGFTKGDAKGNDAHAAISDRWLGLTCAACHTGQVEFGGHKLLIDGAPAMADFEGFMLALVEAMQATVDDKVKLDRFTEKVLGPSAAATDAEAELHRQLAAMTDARRAWNERNQGTSRYGFARLDAIGAIYNEITATALGIAANRKPADAPVSYPFIWDTPQHDRVQWNGSVENAGVGALGRNVGEVLGVFGSLTLNRHLHSREGHQSSVDIEGLGQLEQLAWQLQSPLWPGTILPPIDQGLADQGEATYARLCSHCHAEIDRADPNRRVKASMTPIRKLGTDPMMAVNFITRTSESGGFRRGIEGRYKRYWGILSKFDTFGDEGRNAEFLGYGVIGAITRELFRDPVATIRAIKAGQRPEVVQFLDAFERDLIAADREGLAAKKRVIRDYLARMAARLAAVGDDDPCPDLLCYKARPLNGIWATAPYLHNGSVRTMRQLLLPARLREQSFRVGSRQYDPVDLGFEDAGGYLLDASLPGNSNAGHEYGAEALAGDPDMLNALLEYLKTL